MLSPKKLKSKGHWVLWNIKERTLSPKKLKSKGHWVLWKHKSEDVESYETKKQRTLSPVIHKSKDIESYETKKQRKLDFGNRHIKRNLCLYSLIWSIWVLECIGMQFSPWNAVNVGFVCINAMQKALNHENCAMLMTFFLSYYIFSFLFVLF